MTGSLQGWWTLESPVFSHWLCPLTPWGCDIGQYSQTFPLPRFCPLTASSIFKNFIHLWFIADSRMNNPSENGKASLESGDSSTGKMPLRAHSLPGGSAGRGAFHLARLRWARRRRPGWALSGQTQFRTAGPGVVCALDACPLLQMVCLLAAACQRSMGQLRALSSGPQFWGWTMEVLLTSCVVSGSSRSFWDSFTQLWSGVICFRGHTVSTEEEELSTCAPHADRSVKICPCYTCYQNSHPSHPHSE